MTLPFSLPAWLPWWVPILILVPLLLYALVFFLMPFSVIGVKGRLETLDARLDEIQGEIRSLVLRLPEPIRNGGYDETPYISPPVMAERAPREAPMVSRPPIPPAPQDPGDDFDGRQVRRDARDGRTRSPANRAEPRLDRPRS